MIRRLLEKWADSLIPVDPGQRAVDLETKRVLAAQADLLQAEAERLRAETKRMEDALAAEQAEKERIEELQNKLRIQFIVKLRFAVIVGSETEHNNTLIVTLGESTNGRHRGIMSYQRSNAKGQVKLVTKDVQEFFKLQQVYTNIVLPWIQFQLTTKQVKAKKYKVVFPKSGSLHQWIEFPLSGAQT